MNSIPKIVNSDWKNYNTGDKTHNYANIRGNNSCNNWPLFFLAERNRRINSGELEKFLATLQLMNARILELINTSWKRFHSTNTNDPKWDRSNRFERDFASHRINTTDFATIHV